MASDTYQIKIGGGIQPGVFVSLKSFSGVLKGVTGGLTRMAGLLGIGLGVGAFASFVSGTMQAMDETRKFSEELGVAAGKLHELKFSADLSGAGEVFANGMRRLSKSIAEAGTEGTKLNRLFAEVGVSAVDAAGKIRPADEVLKDFADRFSGWADGANKAAIAQQVFGESQTRFIAMLNQGRAGLEAQGAEFRRLFGVDMAEGTKAFEDYHDNLTRIKTIFQGMAFVLAQRAMPILLDLTQWFIDAFGHGTNFGTAVDNITAGIKRLGAAISVLQTPLKVVSRTLGSLSVAVPQALKGNFSNAASAMGGTFDGLGSETWKRTKQAFGFESVDSPRSATSSEAPGPDARPEAPSANVEQINKLRVQEEKIRLAAQEKIRSEQEKMNAELLRAEADRIGTAQAFNFAAMQILEQEYQAHRDEIVSIAGATESEKNALLEQAARLHQERILAIEKQTAERKRQIMEAQVGATAGTLATTAEAIREFGAEGTTAYKAIATAATVMDTARAAIAAYSSVVGIPYVGPVLAPAAAAAAIAFGTAQVAKINGAFFDGGFTGMGPRTEVAGLVHNQEFVIPASRVDEFGAGFFEDIRQGNIRPEDLGGGSGTGNGGGGVNVNPSFAVINNRQDLREFMQKDGWKTVFDQTSKRERRFRA